MYEDDEDDDVDEGRLSSQTLQSHLTPDAGSSHEASETIPIIST